MASPLHKEGMLWLWFLASHYACWKTREKIWIIFLHSSIVIIKTMTVIYDVDSNRLWMRLCISCTFVHPFIKRSEDIAAKTCFNVEIPSEVYDGRRDECSHHYRKRRSR